jgi:hypothetical protein
MRDLLVAFQNERRITSPAFPQLSEGIPGMTLKAA